MTRSPSPDPLRPARTGRLLLAVATLAGGVFLAAAPLRAEPAAPVTVENARILAVPPVSGETAAFLVLVNHADAPVRLTGAASPLAEEVAPMITTHQTQAGKMIMGMKTVPALEVPAHGRLELKPGGDHLMLMMLRNTPRPGDTVALTLRFAPPGPAELTLQVPVVADAGAPAGHSSSPAR